MVLPAAQQVMVLNANSIEMNAKIWHNCVFIGTVGKSGPGKCHCFILGWVFFSFFCILGAVMLLLLTPVIPKK